MEHLPLAESLRLLREGTGAGKTVRALLIEHPGISDDAVATFFAQAAATAQGTVAPILATPASATGEPTLPTPKRRGRPPRATKGPVVGAPSHGAPGGGLELGNPIARHLGLGERPST